MGDGDVKIHVSADAGNIDGIEKMRSELKKLRDMQWEAEKGSDQNFASVVRRKADKVEKSIKSSERAEAKANPKPTPAPAAKWATATEAKAAQDKAAAAAAAQVAAKSPPLDSLDKKRAEVKQLRADQKQFEADKMPALASSTRRQADKLEKEIDRESARRLRVEDDEARRAEKAAKEKQRAEQTAAKTAAKESEKAAKEKARSEAEAEKRAKNDPLEKQRSTIAKGLVEEGAARAAGNTKAADAIRGEVDIMQEALGLQKKHGISQKDAFLIARSNRQEEGKVTQEIKEQTAMRKAGIGTRGFSRAVGVGEQMLSGGNPASSASSLLMQTAAKSGNPAVMAGAIAAAIATAALGVSAQEADREKMQLLQKNTRVANTKFDMGRQMGVYGSSAGLVNTALDAEREISERRNARPELVEKAREKWHDSSTWQWFGMRKNQGTRDLEENDAKSAEAQARMVEAQNKAKERYIQTEGGLELDTLRQRSKRTLAGSRKAFVDEEAGKAFAKYQEVMKQSGNKKMAEEMATLTYQNDLRDRQANAGAGLVDARSGGAEMSAAARWAMQGTPAESEVKAEVGRLIGVVQQGNQAAQTLKHSK